MTTRFNTDAHTRFGVPPLPSGFASGSLADFTLPPVGVEDVDRALFKLFNEEIGLQVTGKNRETTNVTTVFAAGEKWAQLKRGKALRDNNGSLIVPLVSMYRTSLVQSATEDITGRGMNQQTGEIVIARRLSSSDRNYQSLINKYLLTNQSNVALKSDERDDLVDGLIVDRTLGGLYDSVGAISDGALLVTDRTNNVTETLTIPAPQFFTATYEVVMWAQYQTQMNQMIETLISSFLPQGQCWKISTDKGYWFVASVDGNTWNPQGNVEDMSNEERLIKYQFTVKVPGYVLASDAPGLPVVVKRHVSCPDIKFSVDLTESHDPAEVDDPFLGSDDPTLPVAREQNKRLDQRDDGSTLLYPRGKNISSPMDPALGRRGAIKRKKIIALDRNGNRVTRYVTSKVVNAKTGETIYQGYLSLGGLTIIAVEDPIEASPSTIVHVATPKWDEVGWDEFDWA